MDSHLALMHTREDSVQLIMDLSAVRSLRPVHMVAAVARAHAAREAGLAFHMVGPAMRDPGVYAARMRVGSNITRPRQRSRCPAAGTPPVHPDLGSDKLL